MKASIIVSLATLAAAIGHAQSVPPGKYTPCVDYFSVGGSQCEKPVPQAPAPAQAAVQSLVTPSKADPVQTFLDNHGKPPREFAEFYVNPTPENARRWVEAFRAQQAKAETLAKAWGAAEQGVAAPGKPEVTAVPQNEPAVEPFVAVDMAPAIATPTAPRLGRYATPAAETPVLVYYFSASCPICARLKPELMTALQRAEGKLIFTCVDVTPLSPSLAPNPSNRAGLACDWRLPQPGELERLQIRQTPTLLISRPNTGGQRLTGLLTAAQLQNAIFGRR